MKYLRKYNESFSDLCIKISVEERNLLISKIHRSTDHITKNEFDKIKNLFNSNFEFIKSKSLIKNPKNPNGELLPVISDIIVSYNGFKVKRVILTIEKVSDDWWIVNAEGHGFYKCDQIDGIIEFIKTYIN